LRNIMRTPILASLFGLALIACAGQIDSGGGDDDIPENCGNGVVDVGEDCDGGATCSAQCTNLPIPRLEVTVDKPTVATELLSTNMITVTLTGSGGFAGDVPLTATVVDAADAPIPGWAVVLDKATVTVPTDGVATAVATLTIPSQASALAGRVKIVAATTVEGTHTQESAITALNQVTFTVKLNANGQCDYAPLMGAKNMTVGTKVRWLNGEAAGGNNITIHINGNGTGLNHQPDPGSAPGAAYEQIIGTASANAAIWYCHAPGPDLVGPISINALAQ
jgi:hypothetical protein